MSTKLKPRKCRKCKAEFTPKTDWQKYCGRSCRAAVFHAKKMKLARIGQKSLDALEKGAA